MAELDLAPAESFELATHAGKILLLACGALAREIVDLREKSGSSIFDIQCLPAKWHNTPQYIVPALRQKIKENAGRYNSIFVLYGDCGTGGELDKMLKEEGVERIEGPHCYAFFSGNDRFAETAEDEVTAFYLTDYLARHFDKLVWQGLGLDRHPELLPDYFANYTHLIYLAQTDQPALKQKAEKAAAQLGLAYDYRYVGYGDLETELTRRTR